VYSADLQGIPSQLNGGTLTRSISEMEISDVTCPVLLDKQKLEDPFGVISLAESFLYILSGFVPQDSFSYYLRNFLFSENYFLGCWLCVTRAPKVVWICLNEIHSRKTVVM
jgi:hypothetical protein